MDEKTYVARVLARYRKLPGALDRVLRDDRRTALDLYRRNIPMEIVENAFILVIARRARRPTDEQPDPIRTLRYILPVIQELLSSPPTPGYLQYLEHRIREERPHPPRLILGASNLSRNPPLARARSLMPQSEKPATAPSEIAREASSGIA